MRMSARIFPWLCATLLLSGCIQAASYEKHDSAFIVQEGEQHRWKKLAVLPFSGSPESNAIAADWFAHKLRIEKLIEIISPMAAKTALKKHAIIVGDQPLPLPEAQRLGVMLGADAVVVGSIDLEVSASLIDVASGTVVATSVHPPTQSSPFSDYNLENATDQVCRDMIAVLQEMAAQRAAPAAGR
jgi:hypothetical protein